MMSPMITPRIKPSSFWRSQPGADLFVQDQRQAKLGGFIANLAAMDELIDSAAIAARVATACPRADRSKGGRPPYPDVPPVLSSAAIWSPIPNDKEIGREEAFYRRADHRLPA